MAIFHGLGLLEKLIEIGKPANKPDIFYEHHRVASVHLKYLPSKFNYYLSITQPELEKIIEEELKALGVSVSYNHELITFSKNKSGILAITQNRLNGNEIELKPSYLIGCDGAHSRIRKLLNLSFEGPNYPVHLLLADLKLHGASIPRCITYYVKPQGFLMLAPMATGYTRIVVKKDGELDEHAPPFTLDEAQPYLDAYLPSRLTATDCIWSSRARINARIANKFRVDNVFLAGDACHIFSPIGGQTMNVGFQGAIELAWRIAYVLKKKTTTHLLDEYETNRKIVVDKVLQITDSFTRLIIGENISESLRAKFKPNFRNRKFYKTTLPTTFSGFTTDFRTQTSTLTGSHVPYCTMEIKYRLELKSTYDLLSLKKFVLLYYIDHTRLNAIEDIVDIEMIELVGIDSQNAEIVKIFSLNLNRACLISPSGYISVHGTIKEIEIYLRDLIIGVT